MNNAYVCSFIYDNDNLLVKAMQRGAEIIVPYRNNPKK